MSTRDRWTVYPLLFLALGAALRSKVTSSLEVESVTSRQVEAKSVLCDDLQLNGKDGKPRIRLGTTRSNTAGIEIYGREGNVVAVLTVDPQSDLASLRFQTAQGIRQVAIGSDANGGIFEAFSKTGQPTVLIHSTPGGGTVTAADAEGKARGHFEKPSEDATLRTKPPAE